jgi:transcriptional regulator GlxA family with amidase domain
MAANRRMAAPVRVAIVAFDGCMTTAVAGVLDALAIANHNAGRLVFDAGVVAARDTVAGSGGFAIPAAPLDDAAWDVAIVPPILGPLEETLAANAPIAGWLARRAADGAIVASVCAGAFFLARAGLLAGRRATTNPMFADLFRRAHPDTQLEPERRLVDEGRVLSAGSTTAFLDLAVYLVDRFAGHDVAVATAKMLSVDKNARSQLPYFLHFARRDHGDAAVLALQSWLEDHFTETPSGEDLARRGGMSQRSLNRRFLTATGMTPTTYLHHVRIEAAKRLLETTALTVDEITARVGYEDARSFSRLFQRLAGLPPRDYRARFGDQRHAA